MAQQNPIYVTPAGELLYPHLVTPDTKFVPEGIYDAKIILTPSDERDALIKVIETAHEDSRRAAAKENPKTKIKTADLPYDEESDDDGNLTGNIVLHAKMKAYVKTKAGKEWSQSPDLFDARNQKITGQINPWSGTVAKLAFEVIPFFTALIGAGVTLRLKAAQILTLVEGGTRSAEDYGFEQDADGYEHETTAADEEEVVPF